MIAGDWQSAFFAVSALLGEPPEAATLAVGDAGTLHAAQLAADLRSPSREVRARAIARALAPVALALDAERLA